MVYVTNKADIAFGYRIPVLVKEHDWDGRGYAMGWYAAEFYTNAHVIAYLDEIAHKVCKCDQHFKEIQIFSIYQEHTITAESDEEAIMQFSKMCFIV